MANCPTGGRYTWCRTVPRSSLRYVQWMYVLPRVALTQPYYSPGKLCIFSLANQIGDKQFPSSLWGSQALRMQTNCVKVIWLLAGQPWYRHQWCQVAIRCYGCMLWVRVAWLNFSAEISTEPNSIPLSNKDLITAEKIPQRGWDETDSQSSIAILSTSYSLILAEMTTKQIPVDTSTNYHYIKPVTVAEESDLRTGSFSRFQRNQPVSTTSMNTTAPTWFQINKYMGISNIV